MKLNFDVVLEKQDKGYTAYVPALNGCISQGETKKETISNIKEAIDLYLEEIGMKKANELLKNTKIEKRTINA